MLSFVAGVLSILSPCVLPLLPIVLGAAASEQKWGPAALAAGLSISFVAIGLFVLVAGAAMALVYVLILKVTGVSDVNAVLARVSGRFRRAVR